MPVSVACEGACVASCFLLFQGRMLQEAVVIHTPGCEGGQSQMPSAGFCPERAVGGLLAVPPPVSAFAGAHASGGRWLPHSTVQNDMFYLFLQKFASSWPNG